MPSNNTTEEFRTNSCERNGSHPAQPLSLSTRWTSVPWRAYQGQPRVHQRMLKEGTAEALLVVKLDRLTRSVVDLGTLVDRYFAPSKAALLSVGEQIDNRSAAGRLVLNVLASVSQWEREAIGERTATAMQHKANQGEYTGGWAPYGQRVAADGTRLEEDADEAQARDLARQLRAQGLKLRGVAAELERRGIRSRTGRGFAPVQVKRMVA